MKIRRTRPFTRKILPAIASLSLASAALAGCAVSPEDVDPPHAVQIGDGKSDSSLEATFLKLTFDAELVTSQSWDAESQIRDQLLYTIGHLNGDNSVGRLDSLKLTNVKSDSDPKGYRIRYHAELPVAWGKPTQVPSTYALTLPVNVNRVDDFTAKYKDTCAETGAHDVNQGSMWYYFRPAQSGCRLDAADVIETTAQVALSNNITQDKYPEYDKVWEDNELRVVAVFGKYENGATSASDAGISAYNEFVEAVKQALAAYEVTTTPATLPTSPGVATPDITMEATLADGKKVVVNVLLVDNVAAAGETFYGRYEGLSTRADLIAYNGHAGLGQNVRALARRGKFVSGQYAMVFMNGCDTYAYVDGYLATARAQLNPDDPSGTKYLDFIVNAMPAFFKEDSEGTMAIINALLSYKAPLNYHQIFESIDPSQVVLVTGEEDNVFTPGGTTNPEPNAFKLDELGTVTKSQQKRYTTAKLDPGTYVIQTVGTGDADLYVRKGSDPSTNTYECRPYVDGTNERCEVKVTTPSTIHIMVRGYAASSDFHLTGTKK